MNFFSDYSLTINGKSVYADETFEVINPATEDAFAVAPDTSQTILDSAVITAQEAYKSWRNTSLSERQALLKKAGQVIEQHVDELAELLTCEQGRALPFAKAEVEEVVQVYFHYLTTSEITVQNHDHMTFPLPPSCYCGQTRAAALKKEVGQIVEIQEEFHPSVLSLRYKWLENS